MAEREAQMAEEARMAEKIVAAPPMSRRRRVQNGARYSNVYEPLLS
jgi:hypothetical protein